MGDKRKAGAVSGAPSEPSAPSEGGAPGAQSDAIGEGAQDSAPTVGAGSSVHFDDLPVAVRSRVLSFAAQALGAIAPGELPASLVPVARFAPAKRAKLAAAALASAVRTDHAFRALVARQAMDADGPTPTGDDRVGAAARAFLLHLPGLLQALTAVEEATTSAALHAQVVGLSRTVQRLTAEVSRLACERDEALSVTADAESDTTQEVDRLRRRLREQGSRLGVLERQAAAAGERDEQQRAAGVAALDRAQRDAQAQRQRADAALAQVEQARRSLDRQRAVDHTARATSDRRIELLLTALEQSAAGLRREWDLTSGGPDPADVVAATLPGLPVRAERAADPALLTAWLSVPGVHLVVDGYNVTKTGYPGLSLADQRNRLIHALGALASRTSAEVTVVFDGAAVTVAPPRSHGIRVLFSPENVIADDVIRQLVHAEPAGRAVIVVSSDREVVDGVRVDGARTAPSSVLLAALG